MKTKSTYEIDPKLLKAIKVYAAKNKTTLGAIINETFKQLTKNETFKQLTKNKTK